LILTQIAIVHERIVPVKLQLLGTGSILTAPLSASSIVDDRILVDAPNGAMKAMRRRGLNPETLDACFITHFHADHYFDVVFLLLEVGLRSIRDDEFLLAGPVGLEARVETLFELAYPESWKNVRKNSRVTFHEWPDNGGEISFDNYTMQAVPVQHTTDRSFGYIIHDGSSAVGFSGDSEMCDGIKTIVQNVSTAVLDASFATGRSGHMGADEVVEISAQFPAVRVIATHMSDAVRSGTWPGVLLPSDGDCYWVGP
jgi:ribonuclease BN (tRNA processing enzyme)